MLLKDIEYDVAHIISGHPITLTYDLYTEVEDSRALLVPTKDQVLDPFFPVANEHAFATPFLRCSKFQSSWQKVERLDLA